MPRKSLEEARAYQRDYAARRRRRNWTEAEAECAKKMRTDGLDDVAIAAALGRSVASVMSKIGWLKQKASEVPTSGSLRLSEQIIAERERRSAAANDRDLTAVMMGDPPKGFSALDRQRQTEPA